MAERYESSERNYDCYSSDFKRDKNNENEEDDGNDHRRSIEHDNPNEANPASQKAAEYVRDLLAEKLSLDQGKHRNASRLIDEEITKVQTLGRIPARDVRYVDIYREKPIKVTVKVLVPIREHPRFNFVGKLLGPKGNSMKRLQEETMCKMAILGRGSMRDRQKEEELRQSLEPKYAHLNDELHVEISALGPPAEAHARIAFALAEVRKYLIPDSNDNIRQEQLRELEIMTATDPNAECPFPTKRSTVPRGMIPHERMKDIDDPTKESPLPPKRPALSRAPRGPPIMRSVSRPTISSRTVMPAKTKIMSILDRARVAMEESYGGVEEPYEPVEPAYVSYPAIATHAKSYSTYSYGQAEYESEYYTREPEYEPSGHRWKNYKSSGGTSRPLESSTRYRASPYTRSAK
ncbi:KH domain-containing, RNA-binding, signal transduction-associated protein 2-like isoform X2 [Agrilus planipennis]|uniref:KH domain-containing, RNA-binding, signal transduction-associated protein 2-like isoform X2 n=1 Tax=Agrilus planipennis TaxID=224129 RepID=A0A7F5RG37_AGRPL|nr:KH domain-containing, RNA-binding, signal transduction-associated protein 2-like isoform X2 [Agrilus planipennis]